MYDVEADQSENRLYIDLSGRMEKPELEEAADAVLTEAENLHDGFDIVNDLTGFAPPSPDDAVVIKEAQSELRDMGLDRVIRVTDDETSDVVTTAFERRSRDVGYSGETANSVTEAEAMLDKDEVVGYTGT